MSAMPASCTPPPSELEAQSIAAFRADVSPEKFDRATSTTRWTVPVVVGMGQAWPAARVPGANEASVDSPAPP